MQSRSSSSRTDRTAGVERRLATRTPCREPPTDEVTASAVLLLKRAPLGGRVYACSYPRSSCGGRAITAQLVRRERTTRRGGAYPSTYPSSRCWGWRPLGPVSTWLRRASVGSTTRPPPTTSWSGGRVVDPTPAGSCGDGAERPRNVGGERQDKYSCRGVRCGRTAAVRAADSAEAISDSQRCMTREARLNLDDRVTT